MYSGATSISIYTLSDLGDLSNLIGSLSRAIQQGGEYKADEQNRCRELGVLPKFRSKAFLKIHEYPSADDFEGKKDFMVLKQRDLL